MATDARKSTTSQTAKNNEASSPRADSEPRPTEKRDEKRTKTGQAKRTKPPAQGSRKATQKPKRKPYQMEITALADTTAELPPPWRERAIHVVRAIVGLFERVWREMRHHPAPAPSDGNESDAAGSAGPG